MRRLLALGALVGLGLLVGGGGTTFAAGPTDDHGDFAQEATPIPVGRVVDGVIDPDFVVTRGKPAVPDVDWFSFQAEAGVPYKIQTTLGTVKDTVLRLIDADGVTQIETNDNGGVGLASQIRWLFNVPGTYFIEVSGAGPGSYQLLIDILDLHGDGPGTASQLSGRPSVAGTINSAGDEDWFWVETQAQTTYAVELTLDTLPDGTVTIFESDGRTRVASDAFTSRPFAGRVEWVSDAFDTFFVRVVSKSGTTGAYVVTTSVVPNAGTYAFVGPQSMDGTPGRLALHPQPPELSREVIAERDAAFAIANPRGPDQIVGAIPLPSVPATPLPPEGDPAVLALEATSAVAAQEDDAGDAFEILQNSFVIRGRSHASNVGEPTAHNLGRTVLQTGNWYAALSLDSGVNWEYLNPLENTPDFPRVDGGFCCDQVALATTHDGVDVMFWLLQYRADAAGNTLRLVSFEGEDALRTQEFCRYDFGPQEHFDFPNGVWLDFTQLATTDEWLYGSTNAFEIGNGFIGGLIWRVALDDVVGGFANGCTDLTYEFWLSSGIGSISLAEGEGPTMFSGAHLGGTNSHLRLTRIEDDEAEFRFETVAIEPFPPSKRGQINCRTPAGVNPCARGDRRVTAAWRSEDVFGFMWTAAQGGPFAQPHVRVARFRTADMTLIDEPHLYSGDHAFVYPSVGVNARGDIAGTVYSMASGFHPRVYAFIVDEVSGLPPPWELHPLRFGNASPVDSKWGDFSSTLAIQGCDTSWMAGLYTMQGGPAGNDAEHRFVAFGRELDTCTLFGASGGGLPLQPQWNLVGWGAPDSDVSAAVARVTGDVSTVLTWDAVRQGFDSFSADAPVFLNTLQTLTTGDGVWMFLDSPNSASWEQPSATGSLAFDLTPGFNLVMWTGANDTPMAEAIAGIGRALLAVFTWDALQQRFLSFSPSVPAFLNTATTLNYGDGVWVQVSDAAAWSHGSP